MIVLGINVFHADTSACILKDGKIIAACEEERFTRIKHFTGFPFNSINHCLNTLRISLNEVDYITVNYNLKYNFLERTKFLFSNLKSSNILNKLLNIYNKKSLSDLFIDYFGINCEKKIKFIPHHKAHIASSFFTSGMEDAVGISIDGTGDFSSLEISECKNDEINVFSKNIYPHSAGILYQAITQFLGFRKYGDEYKVMALAAYGKPNFKKEFEDLIIFKPPYNFELNLKYFVHHRKLSFKDGLSDEPIFENLFSYQIEELLGKARTYKEEINQKHKDIASSLQCRFEEIILKIINNLYLENRSDNLCLSGGCIFNSVLNGKIAKKSNFKNIHIHANVGDAGGSLGSALYFYKKNNRKGEFLNLFDNYYLGPSYSNLDVKKSISKNAEILKDFNILEIENFKDLKEKTANILKDGSIIGWFQDRMEWGPRALGNRSILVDASINNVKEILNRKIKLRERFRPFAASVIEEDAKNYFEIDKNYYPNMNFVFKAKSETSEKFPAIVHADGSSRIQTVNNLNNMKFYNLLQEFKKITGDGILLNTSLNIDEPICESPDDVFRSFAATNIDYLVLQNFILERKVKIY